MYSFSALRGIKIHTLYGVAGIILAILVLGSFIAPRYTEAQTGKPVLSEKKVEGSITKLGKDYIVVDGKKYMVSKELKIKDQKGNFTTPSLERLRLVDRIRMILQDNVVTEIHILSYTS
jgi:hypothetical protein